MRAKIRTGKTGLGNDNEEKTAGLYVMSLGELCTYVCTSTRGTNDGSGKEILSPATGASRLVGRMWTSNTNNGNNIITSTPDGN